MILSAEVKVSEWQVSEEMMVLQVVGSQGSSQAGGLWVMGND